MSESHALIGCVTDVQPHPNSEKLDIVSIGGKINIADRPASGISRYKVGDYAVILVENLILPEWLLKHMGLWNPERRKGLLAGNKGTRTKARNIAGLASEVALCKIGWKVTLPEQIADFSNHAKRYITIWLEDGEDDDRPMEQLSIQIIRDDSPDYTPAGEDVTELLEIKPFIASP